MYKIYKSGVKFKSICLESCAIFAVLGCSNEGAGLKMENMRCCNQNYCPIAKENRFKLSSNRKNISEKKIARKEGIRWPTASGHFSGNSVLVKSATRDLEPTGSFMLFHKFFATIAWPVIAVYLASIPSVSRYIGENTDHTAKNGSNRARIAIDRDLRWAEIVQFISFSYIFLDKTCTFSFVPIFREKIK